MSKTASENILVVGFAHFRQGFEHVFAGGEGMAYCDKESHWDKMTKWRRARMARRFRLIHFFWAKMTLAEFILIKAWRPRIRIILHFIGSDVSLIVAKKRRILEYRFYQWCGVAFYADHQNLVDELAAHGLRAELLVLANTPLQAHNLPMPDQFSVLAYVPGGKEKFYHLGAIEAAAAALPDVPFTIWRNDIKFARPNMSAKPFVKDVIEEFGRHTVFVRLTEHDGLPSTILEALSCGRQVVWSFDFPHCHRARTASELAAVLEKLKSRSGFNTAGQHYVLEQYNMDRVRENFHRAWREMSGI
ncbi:hypothetical protein JXO59_02400 [candidate division KSB1 bacterium]|nr:hypothetical protein [candidate division KSB1 bacterium]